ncbi:MAG: hypothetical protein JEZ02_08150 [Desulfatibacillum sp.]|nr:hypothetical protein [Desulfatibacillum sp.]
MDSMEKEQSRLALEDFERIKQELSKVPPRQSGIIAETFQKQSVADIEYSIENHETLKRIHAYEARKQDYFTKWLKAQQNNHAKTEKEFRRGQVSSGEEENQPSFFLILTVDLTGARPWALAKLEKALRGIGFEKFSSKEEGHQKRLRFPGFGTSANIYSAQVQVEDVLDIEPERDRINDDVKALMDREREKGTMEEYRYILFISKQWAWQEEGTS